MGLDGMHPQVLGELVSLFHRPLLKYTKDKDVAGNGQVGLAKEESHLTDLTCSCAELTNSMDDGEQQRLLALPLITNTLNLAVSFQSTSLSTCGTRKATKGGLRRIFIFYGCQGKHEG